jgi:hypothetical protein
MEATVLVKEEKLSYDRRCDHDVKDRHIRNVINLFDVFDCLF